MKHKKARMLSPFYTWLELLS